jgi:hypothetical protein
VKPSTLRCAVAMARQASTRIRAAGRIPPDDCELTAAMIPAARRVLRTSRWLRCAAANHQAALDAVAAAADAAEAAIAALAAEWVARPPEPGTDAAVFEAIVTTQLADLAEGAPDEAGAE